MVNQTKILIYTRKHSFLESFEEWQQINKNYVNAERRNDIIKKFNEIDGKWKTYNETIRDKNQRIFDSKYILHKILINLGYVSSFKDEKNLDLIYGNLFENN